MKKVYSKPEIMFEDFTVAASIAACDLTPKVAENVCPVEVEMDPFGKITIFASTDCQFTPPNPDDLVCYHVSTGAVVFGS